MSQRVFLFLVLFLTLQWLPSHAQVAPPVPPQASSKARSKRNTTPQVPMVGLLEDGVYRNAYFGFSCQVPYGWVDRTEQMSDGAEAGKSMVLLSVFERPPQATGEGVNSAIVIAAESAGSYPGLKTAAEYFGPLSEMATSKGFKVVEEPYEFAVGTKAMVRSDFSKDAANATLYQASLVVLEKGYAESFTFLGSNKDEVDGLIENLAFGPASTQPKTSK